MEGKLVYPEDSYNNIAQELHETIEDEDGIKYDMLLIRHTDDTFELFCKMQPIKWNVLP